MPCCNLLLAQDFEESWTSSSSDALHEHQNNGAAAGGGFCSDKALPSYAPNDVLEVIHMTISLSVDLPNEAIEGSVKHSIRNPRKHVPADGSILAAELSRITFNAVSAEIQQVLDTATGAPLDYSYDGKLLQVRFAKPFAPLETKIVEIKYRVEKPIAGLYFHVPDETIKDKVIHCITDHETERARYWLPCVDYPAVRTTLEFHLTAPKQYTSYANGADLGSNENADGTKTTSYKLDSPCPSYLICMAVGDYVEVADESVDGMPIKYIAPSNVSAEDLMTTFDRTPTMVRWLQEKVGYKFPWPKYYQIISPEIQGGAMENISLVTYTDRLCIDKIAATSYIDVVDSVNLHEMAHTYFGDLLVMRHFEHAWLKESWATYFSSLWLEDTAPWDEFRYKNIQNIKSYIAETGSYMRPIVTRTYDSSWELFDAHLYPGGAMRLHMLRCLLGDDVFWAAVKKYVNKFANKLVETEDFKRCLEEESGLNLTRFFDQWLFGIGYPKVKASYSYDSSKKRVQIVLEQTQVSKKDGIPVFDLSVEVEVVDAEGKLFKTTVVFEEDNPRAIGFVRVEEAKPAFVEIDPNGKVLMALEFAPDEDMMEAMIKKGRDIGTRIHAYKELVKSGSVTAMKKVRENLPSEQFWAVRAEAYRALSAAKTQAAVDILASSLLTETNPRALTVLVMSSNIRDAAIRKGLLHVLSDISKLAYNTRSQAYTQLGRQRHPDDLPLLLAAASDPNIGTAGIVRAGVMTGLGLHRSPEAHAFLLSRLPRGSEPMRGQVAVIAALAESAQWLDRVEKRKTAEEIAVFLRDPSHVIRASAVGALQVLKAAQHAAAAAATLVTFPEQDKPGYQKKIRGIREPEGAEGKVKELAGTVEELEGKLKKLEQQYQLLEAKLKEEAEKKKSEEKKEEKVEEKKE
ncbi:hypothetical protein HDU96_001312 [Phlyctochytrium bullatum]|nr:hypothetical protein HDU96_001312 [Phlyctochytrium bullatum]